MQETEPTPSQEKFIQDLLAADVETQLQMMHSLDKTEQVYILNQLPASVRAKMYAQEMANALNYNVRNNTPTR